MVKSKAQGQRCGSVVKHLHVCEPGFTFGPTKTQVSKQPASPPWKPVAFIQRVTPVGRILGTRPGSWAGGLWADSCARCSGRTSLGTESVFWSGQSKFHESQFQAGASLTFGLHQYDLESCTIPYLNLSKEGVCACLLGWGWDQPPEKAPSTPTPYPDLFFSLHLWGLD